MNRFTPMLTMIVIALVPVGCAPPSASGCEDSTCEDGTGSSGDGTGTSAGATSASMTTTEPADSTGDVTGEPPATTAETASESTGEEPPEACPSTHACLEVAPAGWAGPYVRRTDAGDATPADCAGAYPVDGGLYALDPSSPPQSCICSCGDALGVTCTATILYSQDAVCDASDATHALPHTNCINIADTTYDYWRILSEVESGACSVQPSTEIPPVEYASSVRYCGTDTRLGGCEEGELCLPIPAVPVTDVWCIVREGEHECPADGPYVDGGVRYTAHEDSRGCSACGCGSPEGTCSGYTATLHTENDCAISVFGGSVDGTCSLDPTASAPTIRAVRRAGDPTFNVDCAPTGGDPTGELALQDPITVCCTQ